MKNKFFSLLIAAVFLNIALNSSVQASTAPNAMQSRINLLEAAFYPNTPDSIAKLFSKAALEGNGAIQYMLLAPELRQHYKADLEKLNWLTGTANVKITSYGVVNTEQTAKLWKYAIHFTLQGIDNKPYFCINHIEIGQIKNEKQTDSPLWAITQVEFLDPARECKAA